MVFCADDVVLVLEQYNSSNVDSKASYHVVSQASIVSVQVVAPPPPSPTEDERADLPAINQDTVTKRLERSVARATEERKRINENVTVREQAVFSELSKTMQCAWHEDPTTGDQVILVMDSVSGRALRTAALGFVCCVILRRSDAGSAQRTPPLLIGPLHGPRRLLSARHTGPTIAKARRVRRSCSIASSLCCKASSKR